MPGLPNLSTADAKVSECERILAYTFTNKHLILEALQMQGSMVSTGAPVLFDGQILNVPLNKKLASHGDIVFDFIVNSLWLTHPNPASVNFDYLKQRLLTRNALNKRGVSLGLDRCIMVNPGTGFVSKDMMAETFEAVIGAVNLDGGVGAAQGVVEHLGFLEAPLL
ncbi:hypothetical protein K491DRAFT_631533, partial [Lophiostoma macrostomum CBS 122681]